MEVGHISGGTVNWSRAHFGAWSVRVRVRVRVRVSTLAHVVLGLGLGLRLALWRMVYFSDVGIMR